MMRFLDSIIFWMPQLVWVVLALTSDADAVVASTRETNNKSEWYTKYPEYHPYCSTPSQMETRKIPPLKERPQDTRLVHVTSIIRHGARTPYAGASTIKCWEGYWENPQTGIWDCALTTMLAPPSPQEIQKVEGKQDGGVTTNDDQNDTFLFEKKYVAFDEKKDSSMYKNNGQLRNILNGTCQLGQLLLHGYEQQLTNGRFLRDAYFYDSSKEVEDGGFADSHNPRMKLADLSDPDKLPYVEPQLYYRADDDQRTLMSGQVLLRGLFGEEFAKYAAESSSPGGTSRRPVITLHTVDREHDILAPNPKVCPRLSDLHHEALASKEYHALNNSKDVEFLRTYMSNELYWDIDGRGVIDCIMTSMCTDRPIPDLINDYKGPNSNIDAHHDSSNSNSFHPRKNLLERIFDFSVSKWVFVLLYNNAAYSKLAMTPLWKEIWDNISPVIGDPQQKETSSSTPKLALISGHDNTIIPLMASLGNRAWNLTYWPPYASMMLIEIHEFLHDDSTPAPDDDSFKTKFAFRLLHNGDVMTQFVDGCPSDSDLCDVQILQAKVESIISVPWNCESNLSKEISSTNNKESDNIMSASGGFLSTLVIVIASAAAGAFATFVYLAKRLPFSTINEDSDHMDSEVPLIQQSHTYGSTA